MNPRIQELRRQKGQLVTELRSLAERENFGAEDQAQYDRISGELDKIDASIARLEESDRRSAEVSSTPVENRENPAEAAAQGDAEARLRAFRGFLTRGINGLTDAERRLLTVAEARDLQADTDTAGGFIVPPQEFVNRLIKALDDSVVMRRLGTTMNLTQAASLGAPSLAADPEDADWTSEVAQSDLDTAMTFGKRELSPHALSKEIKVSRRLIRLGAQPVEDLVRDRLSYKFGLTEEKGFLTGNGAQQPLGVFTASASGISTGRDVVTGSATDVTADGLIDAFYTLKEAYQRRATWLFHRDAVKRVRKLKDTTNQYIWQPGLQAGQPDTILGRPVVQSEYVPNTFTTGLYVGMVADFSHYWIVTALNLTIQRLDELYARTNQVGFIGRAEVDGMPVLEEAFVRIKTS